MPQQRLDQILASHAIAFSESGDELLVHCPLCGDGDPSEHLSISTRKRGWRCLRNPRQHKGRSYVRLLTLVLRCSPERAKELLGVDDARPLPAQEEFSAQWRKQLGLEEAESPEQRKLYLPKEFHELHNGARRAKGFWEYLRDRGFTEEQTDWICYNYDIHYALSGRYAYRLIIPVYSRSKRLMTWTARSIDPKADIRYMTLSKEFARAAPGELLLGLPRLMEAPLARCLVICEGPFDAIAVSALGHSRGVWGTCLFGLELSTKQADLLTELDERFDRIRLAVDPEAMLRVLALTSSLPRRCKPLRLPDGVEDPGDLVRARDGLEFIESLAA